MQPTSRGFHGVSAGREQYKGLIKDLDIALFDTLRTKINVAVIPSDAIYLLIGNDLIGGAYAKSSRMGMNDLLGNMLLQDAKG